MVVIRDLSSVVQEIAARTGQSIQCIAQGARHHVYALVSETASVEDEVSPLSRAQAATSSKVAASADSLYVRDRVRVGALDIDRPFDISGDSAKLKSAVPVLLDALPKKELPQSILCLRAGYGAVALNAAALWPSAKVVAFDRDVLATTFLRENAARLNLRVDVREAIDATAAMQPGETFDLVVGEISSAAGAGVAEIELLAIQNRLSETGQALLLTLEKTEREFLRGIATRKKLSLTRLIARDGNVVLRMTRS